MHGNRTHQTRRGQVTVVLKTTEATRPHPLPTITPGRSAGSRRPRPPRSRHSRERRKDTPRSRQAARLPGGRPKSADRGRGRGRRGPRHSSRRARRDTPRFDPHRPSVCPERSRRVARPRPQAQWPNPYEGSVVKRENHPLHRSVGRQQAWWRRGGAALDDALLWRSCPRCQPTRRLHPTRIRTRAAGPRGVRRLCPGTTPWAGPDAVTFPTSGPFDAAGSSPRGCPVRCGSGGGADVAISPPAAVGGRGRV